MKWIWVVLFAWTSLVQAEEEIVVKLTTESRLMPIYLCSWTKEACSRDNSYLQELMGVMHFDFDHNGMTEVAATSVERRKQQQKERDTGRFDAAGWRRLGIMYVVHGKVTQDKLALSVESVSSNSTVAGYNLPLTGNLADDRRRLHIVHDAIHATLFDKPGIASTRVLYTIRHPQEDGTFRSEVWAADYDGASSRQLTKEGSYCVTPTFMPPAPGSASGAFFYVCYKNSQPKIYIASLEDGNGQRLISLRGNQFMPMASPNRDLVAFVSDAPGNADLFIQPFSLAQGAIGKPVQIFSAQRGTQASPTFSPDGKQIAFVSNKDGTPRIYVMEVPLDGPDVTANPQIISRRNRGNTSPSWSPDGKKIAYSAMTDGTRQIWIYDFETDTEKQITSGYGHKENPSWAANSLHLVFNSSSKEGCDLYITNLHQPRAVKITSGSGEARFPSWEPRNGKKPL